MKVSLYNQQGSVVGETEVSEKLFAVQPDAHVLAEATYVQQTSKRLGLSHTKTRGEVRGGGKKPWKQKGTGRARAGSIRSPLWRKGGITFGPRNDRNWERKLNKKTRVKALAMALTDKLTHERLVFMDAFELTENKTKLAATTLANFVKAMTGFGKKHLLVVPSGRAGYVRAVRNLPNVTWISAHAVNLVEVLKAEDVIVLKESVPVMEKTFVKASKAVK